MKPLEIDLNGVDNAQIHKLKGKAAQLSDVSRIIDKPTLVYTKVNGKIKVLAIFKPFEDKNRQLFGICNSIKFPSLKSKKAIRDQSVSIGWIPRSKYHDDICNSSALMLKDEVSHAVFESFATMIAKSYKHYFKREYANQEADMLEHIKPSYRMAKTTFTGGVINKNKAVSYHFDERNAPNGMSCMLMLSGNISGGEIIIPQYTLGFKCRDKFMLIFDGQSILHGVTPIRLSKNGYRYTVVYFQTEDMKKCLELEEEQLRHKRLLHVKEIKNKRK